MTALKRQDVPGFTPRTLDAANQLADSSSGLAQRVMGELAVDVRAGRDTLWVVVRRPGKGGIALKTARSAGDVRITGRATRAGGKWSVETESGRFTVKLSLLSDALLRVSVSLLPATDLLLPF